MTRLGLLRIGLACGLVHLACATEADRSDKNRSAVRECVPNQTVVCTCGIEKGSQTCSDDRELSPCDCSEEGKANASKADPAPLRPTPAPDLEPAPKTEPNPSTPKADAGAPPALGPSCQKLKVCCEAFVANDIFSDFCFSALKTGLEDICYLKHKSYADDPELPCPP